MQIGQLKEYIELGVVSGFSLVRNVIEPGWCLLVLGREGQRWTLHTKVGNVRNFASLDTAVGVIEQVGGKVEVLKVLASV